MGGNTDMSTLILDMDTNINEYLYDMLIQDIYRTPEVINGDMMYIMELTQKT